MGGDGSGNKVPGYDKKTGVSPKMPAFVNGSVDEGWKWKNKKNRTTRRRETEKADRRVDRMSPFDLIIRVVIKWRPRFSGS